MIDSRQESNTCIIQTQEFPFCSDTAGRTFMSYMAAPIHFISNLDVHNAYAL